MHIVIFCNKMEYLYLEDCPKIPLTKSMYLQGFSKAGDRTGFLLHHHKFLFDCGVRTRSGCKYIFNTHIHVDHSGEMPYICNRWKIKENYELYTPNTTIQHPMLLFRVVANLCDPNTIEMTDDEILANLHITMHPIEAGNTIVIDKICIDVLPAHHTVQSVGYGLSAIKNQLKNEYIGISGKELATLRKTGIVITDEVKVPEFCFFCDSNIKNLADHTEWIAYPIVVCECTGFHSSKKTLDDYMEMGHTHIDQLLPIMLQHMDKKWVLIHPSTALGKEQLEEIEGNLKQLGLDVYEILY